MPYIREKDRAALDALIAPLVEAVGDEGQLNYVLTRLVDEFVHDQAKLRGEATPRYRDFLIGHGTLEMAAAEFYRRKIAPYEDKQKETNGDAYRT